VGSHSFAKNSRQLLLVVLCLQYNKERENDQQEHEGKPEDKVSVAPNNAKPLFCERTMVLPQSVLHFLSPQRVHVLHVDMNTECRVLAQYGDDLFHQGQLCTGLAHLEHQDIQRSKRRCFVHHRVDDGWVVGAAMELAQ